MDKYIEITNFVNNGQDPMLDKHIDMMLYNIIDEVKQHEECPPPFPKPIDISHIKDRTTIPDDWDSQYMRYDEYTTYIREYSLEEIRTMYLPDEVEYYVEERLELLMVDQ